MTHLRTIAILGIVAALAANALATTIGPDAYGYIATDVPYAWEDISGTGSPWIPSVNDRVKIVNMGFGSSLYGSTDALARFSDNGLVTFGQDNTQAGNVDLTSQAPTFDKPTIAVLWDDWFVDSAGGASVYYETKGLAGSRRFIVQWEDIGLGPFGSAGRVTFEAILYEATGNILLQYQDVVIEGSDGSHDYGQSATVGIRDTGGQTNGRALQWSFNQAVISDGEAIRFSVIPEPLTVAGMLLGIGCLARYVRKRRPA